MVLKRESDYHRLKKIMTYPLVLGVLTAVLFYFVQSVLLPKFSSLYENMNVNSNLFTKLIFIFAESLPVFFYFVVIIFMFASGYFLLFFKKYSILEQRKKLASLPGIGKFLRLFYSQTFSVQLSYLFSSGMSVIEALTVFEKNSQEKFSQELGKEIKHHLAIGIEFDQVIASFSFFESELSRIIRHGQENGKLDQELFFYSQHCLSQLEEKTEKGIKIVQPVLYSIIGLVIVSLYLAILLPMFELIQGI